MTPPHSPCRRYVAGGTMSAASAIPRQSDGGGSNASRVRLWKRELQRLANELGIEIAVHHLPPGTSKWNKIGVSRTHLPEKGDVELYERWGQAPMGAKISH